MVSKLRENKKDFNFFVNFIHMLVIMWYYKLKLNLLTDKNSC